MKINDIFFSGTAANNFYFKLLDDKLEEI